MAIKIQGDTVIYDDKVFRVGSGTSEQRPETPQLGMIWFNTELGSFEGYNGSEWEAIGGAFVPVVGGATGAGQVPAGTIAQRPANPVNGMIRYNTDLLVFEFYIDGNWISGDRVINQASSYGEATYTSPGTHTWVCPAGVTAVNVVCIGGGGSASSSTAEAGIGGGGGGGLGWKNNIPVTPGSSYSVRVGSSASDSYFVSLSLVAGRGGGSSFNSSSGGAGGSFVGDGGGSGGAGGSCTHVSPSAGGGGGGAGGYEGFGGYGAARSGQAYQTGGDGSGGGGGGGASAAPGGGGGGVGVYGIGTSGLGGSGVGSGTYGMRGLGGSDGSGGGYTASGGSFGGGASRFGTAGTGVVRIIWGPDRAFPSTNTQYIAP